MKAPAWLTQAFADGVDERQPPGGIRLRPPYVGAYPTCFLARHDERRRPCSGRIERFHFISRQRVENAMGALLPYAGMTPCGRCVPGDAEAECDACEGGLIFFPAEDRRDLILLAAWDPRNAELGCEGHHRRFDSHLTPALTVPYSALPASVVLFAFEWGIDGQLDRFPSDI